MREKLYETKDMQGSDFAEDRQFTVEGWRELAMIWADMDGGQHK
jgi:hypothetical protein